MPGKKIKAADLFCGGGGSSTGLLQACEEMGLGCDLLAVNHWETAIQTHAANHPQAKHLCVNLDSVEPAKAVPGGKLDILIASPECTHHSNARGSKPMSDQSRASAWHVVRWAESLRPRVVLIENVREFATWGPLGSNGRPLKGRKGATFHAWLDALRSIGYSVQTRVLNAADYGAATTRHRLFVLCVRGKTPPVFPEPTHAKSDTSDLFVQRKPWRAAREIIDWSIQGKPVFGRARPLKPNTISRILAGVQKFAGQPFMQHTTHPCGERVHELDAPVPTITGANRGELALCQPFVITMRGTSDSCLAQTASSTTAGGIHHGIAQPFVLGQQSGSVPRSVEEPLPTISTDGAISLCEPFLLQYHGRLQTHSIEEPLRTVDTRDRYAIIQVNGVDTMIQVYFRMLQPHELAAAMSFPKGYLFKGNKAAVIKQIGNAVDVAQARALCRSQLAA